MGHNRAGANRRARLRRRRRQERRLAPRVEREWLERYLDQLRDGTIRLRGEELASAELIARVRLGPWIVEGEGASATRKRSRDVRIEWVGENHSRWREFEEEPINALKQAGRRHYFFRKDARKIEVLEEFLHDTQERLVRRRPHLAHLEVYPRYELHIKDFMIRHRRLLRISPHDTRVLQMMLRIQMLSGYDENRDPLHMPSSATRRIRR